jgi:Ca2+-dependent lipid-binding protein
MFGAVNPFLEIHRYNEGLKDWQLAANTPHAEKTLKPVWPKVKVKAKHLVCEDRKKKDPVLIRVYDWKKDKPPDLIGAAKTTLSELKAGGREGGWELINRELQKTKKKYENSGVVTLVKMKVEDKKPKANWRRLSRLAVSQIRLIAEK